MIALLLSSNYPGPHAAFWQYFGGALDHLVLLFCFMTFVLGDSERALSLSPTLYRILRRKGRLAGIGTCAGTPLRAID